MPSSKQKRIAVIVIRARKGKQFRSRRGNFLQADKHILRESYEDGVTLKGHNLAEQFVMSKTQTATRDLSLEINAPAKVRTCTILPNAHIDALLREEQCGLDQ